MKIHRTLNSGPVLPCIRKNTAFGMRNLHYPTSLSLTVDLMDDIFYFNKGLNVENLLITSFIRRYLLRSPGDYYTEVTIKLK